jgi:hypothetical protein
MTRSVRFRHLACCGAIWSTRGQNKAASAAENSTARTAIFLPPRSGHPAAGRPRSPALVPRIRCLRAGLQASRLPPPAHRDRLFHYQRASAGPAGGTAISAQMKRVHAPAGRA